MNLFQEALNSGGCTILFGSFGRNPSLVQFYFNAISDLEYASDYELIFWYSTRKGKRLLHVLMEPVFGAIIPSDFVIVLTSHLNLSWNPLTTRIVHCFFPCERYIPFPSKSSSEQEIVVPPTAHSQPSQTFDERGVRVDLSLVDNIHEAYLRLLTFLEMLSPSSKWSLSIPERLRLSLLKEVTSLKNPHDQHLLKVLG